MAFISNIKPPQHGRMRFHFVGARGEIDILASHTPNDPFYEFVSALQAVYESGLSFDIQINTEPKRFILRLSKEKSCLVLSLNTKSRQKLVEIGADFQTSYSAIVKNILNIYNETIHDGFTKQWHHEPPVERIEILRTRISILEQ